MLANRKKLIPIKSKNILVDNQVQEKPNEEKKENTNNQ